MLKGEIGEEIALLKQQPGSSLFLFGGASIAQTCVKQNLIDTYQLLVHPVVLGSGQSLWKEITAKHSLKLVQARMFRSGVVGLSYQAQKEQYNLFYKRLAKRSKSKPILHDLEQSWFAFRHFNWSQQTKRC